MSNPSETLVPLLDQMIAFMEDALQTKQADDSRIAQLTTALQNEKANQERIILEKVAAAKTSVLDTKVMSEALLRLQGMGIIDDRSMEKLASRFKADPNAVFPIMVKMAEKLLSAPGDGQGVDREGESKEASGGDKDGWDDFVQGKPVPRK